MRDKTGPATEGTSEAGILVTGAAGFIGYHLCQRLLDLGRLTVGVDNLNDYYSPQLKKSRLAGLEQRDGFEFFRLDLTDEPALKELFQTRKFGIVVNLAAQPGVRYSLENPKAYIDSNLVGFANLLECCRQAQTPHLVFASSSSVYGLNTKTPFSVHDNVDHPISLYAASKKANELMAHTYAYLFSLPMTGLRFFTVYGPWGRPDMSPHLFAEAILTGRPIKVFNQGRMRRSFTYIDDIIEGLVRIMDRIPSPNPDWDGQRPDPGSSPAPYRLFNIGHARSVELMDFIAAMEKAFGKKAQKEFLPLQPGDVVASEADVADLEAETGFRPGVDLDEGLARFAKWYRSYYRI